MKILHTADWHSRDKDIDEVQRGLEFLVSKAQEEKPDIIIHAGDSFHSRDVKAESQAAKLVISTFSELADIAPVAAILGTNSHDGRAPEILSMVRGTYPIHVSTAPEQIYLLDGRFTREMPEFPYEPELILSMLPQPTKEYFARVTNSSITESDMEIGGLLGAIFMGFGGMAAQWPTKKHVLVFHGTAKGAKLCNGQQMIGREIEVTREHLELARADLGCFGHIHLPDEVFPNMFYAGSTYAVDIGEDGPHGFWLHGWENGKLWSEFVETPTRKLAQVKADMTGENYNLEAGLSDVDFAEASVRVEIKAWQDEAAQIDREAIEKQFKDRGASEVDVRIIRVPRETVRSANIMKLHSLREKVQELASTRGEEVAESILEKADQLEMVVG